MLAIETFKEISPSPRLSCLVLHQLARNIRELALLQLRLPEDGVRIAESVLDPAVLFDVVQVDETTGESISVRSSQNTSASQRQRLLLGQIVSVFSVQHTVCECLTRSNTEEIAAETGSIRVDVVESWTFLLCDTSAHRTHRQTHSLV